ncbi:MAG: hypothetical protein ACXADC_10000 [Candidatus Thorarchaeota archaeon]|jgi:hypothetical protein
MSREKEKNWLRASGARAAASTYGILVGLASIEHGIFEILQGDVPTGDIMIDAIGDAYRFWPGAMETALTIVPNFLWTGILAVVFGILVIIWSYAYVQRKYGASVLLILTITVFLVGGGFAPIFLSLLAFGAATRINKPLNWWRERLPGRSFLAKLWPSLLIVFVIVFWGAVGIQIFGLPLDVATTTYIMVILSLVMVILMPIAIIVAIAFDAQKLLDSIHESSG